MKPLEGHVAMVAGATRGAGRGTARMLGEAGATVYCTGRSSRGGPPTPGRHAGRPETIEETAKLVDAAGGTGIPVRVDHAVEAEVSALFDRVRRERGRLDLLVVVLSGPPVTDWRPFHELPASAGRELVDGWVWPHVVTCRHAAPLMVERRSGLIVEVVEGDAVDYRGHFYLDAAMLLLKRLAYALAEELAPHGVSAVAVTPGFMRTEEILDGFGATEASWRAVAETDPRARRYGLIDSESPCYVGRAVAALAADPAVRERSGGIYSSWGLAEAYGFNDLDGSRPDLGRRLGEFPFGRPRSPARWRVGRAAG